MADWVELSLQGMRERQAQRALARQERGARILAEEAEQQTRAEREQAERDVRNRSEQERAEQIAAGAVRLRERRAQARRPASGWEAKMAAQAAGDPAWDQWDGPSGSAA